MKPDLTPLQKAVIAYLDKVLAAKGDITIYRLSQITGISKSTLGRWYEPTPGKGVPRLDNLKKVQEAAPEIELPPEISIPGTDVEKGRRNGHSEPEIVPLDADLEEGCILRPATATQSVWKLKTRAIEMPPYQFKPGDIVLIDSAISAQAGDAVCAKVSGETVFRAYEPPYLVVATQDGRVERTPQPVDGIRVVILGTVIKSVRIS